jgi:preprotein translocase subunit SecE
VPVERRGQKKPDEADFTLGEIERGHYKTGLVARDRPVPRRESLWRAGHAASNRRAMVRSSKATRAMRNPFEFIQEVRKEAEKVTWPTRRETLITTAMVLVMVVIASVFFLAVDMILQRVVGLILGISHGS